MSDNNKIPEILSDELKEKEAMYGELSYAMGALSLEFSQHDLSVSKSLKNKGIYMFRTKVVSISSEKDLKQAVLESTMNRTMRTTFGFGERHIHLVREGIYKLDPETWSKMAGCIIIGDLAGSRPIFLSKDGNTSLKSRNLFMNIHFKIDNSIMKIMTQDIGLHIPVFFIKCSF